MASYNDIHDFFLSAKGAGTEAYQLALASVGNSKKRGKGDPNHCSQLHLDLA